MACRSWAASKKKPPRRPTTTSACASPEASSWAAWKCATDAGIIGQPARRGHLPAGLAVPRRGARRRDRAGRRRAAAQRAAVRDAGVVGVRLRGRLFGLLSVPRVSARWRQGAIDSAGADGGFADGRLLPAGAGLRVE